MRIAYLLEIDLHNPSGVLLKLVGQADRWKEMGNEVKFFSIPSNEGKTLRSLPRDLLVKNIDAEIFTNPFSKLFKGSFRNYINKILVAKVLRNSIIKYKPDIIYYRQGMWFPGLSFILRNHRSIMEINTNDLEEIRHEEWLRQKLYIFGRQKIIKNVNGIVAVTEELGNLYSHFNKPITVVSNGYSFDDLPPLNYKNKNTKPQIVFVGSPGMTWHGTDKIVKIARHFPDFSFHIVGPKLDTIPAHNVIQHGYLNRQDLFQLYTKMNIGIGSLAMHRINMHEGSPLKVREYCAFGLPVIVGYKDTDLDGQNFVLNIGNYELNVDDNIDKIRHFILEWYDKKLDRKDIEPIISYKYKEEMRLKFFKSFIN